MSDLKVENNIFYAMYLKKENLLSMIKYEHKRSQKDGTYCVECTRGSPVEPMSSVAQICLRCKVAGWEENLKMW